MKTLSAILIASALVVASPVQAQKLDLSVITCKQFVAMDPNLITLIMVWMNGYYTDEDSPPVVDLDKMKQDTAKLETYCKQNPTASVASAAEEALDS